MSLRNLRNFILIFEVVRTQDVSGGAALDDLQFIDCVPCKFFPPMQVNKMYCLTRENSNF